MAQSVTFMLTNSNVAVTGAADGDFTKTLYRDGGATSETVVVSELGSGLYKATFTPVSVDKYHLFINHANDVNYGPAGVSFDWDIDTIRQIEDACIFYPASATNLDSSILNYADLSFPVCYPQVPGYSGFIPEEEFTLTGIVYANIIRGTTEIELVDGGDLTYVYGSLLWFPTAEQIALMLPGDIITVAAAPSCSHNGTISTSPIISIVNTINREKNIEQRGILGATYAITIPFVDGDAAALAGALAQLKDSSDNLLTQGLTRTSDGKVIFLADDGIYRVYPYKTGYSYAVEAGYVEVTVNGADIETSNIVLSKIATGAPADPDKCNVYLNLKDAGSADTNATITLELSDRPNGIGSSDDQAILASSGTVTFTHQGSGEYLAEVYRNATYKVKGVDPKLTKRNAVVTVEDWGQARIYFNAPNKEVIIKELS